MRGFALEAAGLLELAIEGLSLDVLPRPYPERPPQPLALVFLVHGGHVSVSLLPSPRRVPSASSSPVPTTPTAAVAGGTPVVASATATTSSVAVPPLGAIVPTPSPAAAAMTRPVWTIVAIPVAAEVAPPSTVVLASAAAIVVVAPSSACVVAGGSPPPVLVWAVGGFRVLDPRTAAVVVAAMFPRDFAAVLDLPLLLRGGGTVFAPFLPICNGKLLLLRLGIGLNGGRRRGRRRPLRLPSPPRPLPRLLLPGTFLADDPFDLVVAPTPAVLLQLLPQFQQPPLQFSLPGVLLDLLVGADGPAAEADAAAARGSPSTTAAATPPAASKTIAVGSGAAGGIPPSLGPDPTIEHVRGRPLDVAGGGRSPNGGETDVGVHGLWAGGGAN